MRVLFNISNHPSDKWGARQTAAAREIAEVIKDIKFPDVPAAAGTEDVKILAMSIANDIANSSEDKQDKVVHVMGEMSLTAALVAILQSYGIRCVCSCTARDVVELPNGTKQSRFEFVQFREYPAVAIL